MTRKRWCILCAASLVLLLAFIVALVVIVDPFEIYHRAWFYNPPYDSGTQMYAGAGVAARPACTTPPSAGALSSSP